VFSRTPTIAKTDIELAEQAALRVVRTHQRLVDFLKPGLTLGHIDAFVARTLEDLDCKSAFIGYKAGGSPRFPSHACLSVNECVVHGTAGYLTRPLVKGDLLKIDIGVIYKGFIGDAAWTYSFGQPTPDVKRLMDAGKVSLKRGVEQLRPGNKYIAWAQTVQKIVERDFGFHLVRGLGGHGYGRKLHQPPYISNIVPDFHTEWPESTNAILPGTLVAVEPMIAIGTGEVKQIRSEWPVYTADGSMSVHYEHDVLVTEQGPRVLTAELESLPDVIG
jgi:methionyl aminopeptidase